MAPPLTPLTRQYLDLKRKNPDALLFFRCGDFYELFFDDAREASERLGISLTARHKEKDGSGGVPMAGVPHHSVEPYIKRLLDQGCRVAIAEQLSDPKQTKGLVERGVVEVVTPGTVTAWSMLDERRANHVLAIAPARTGSFGLAWLEVTTGRLVVTDVPEQAILDEVARVEPSEVLIPDDERGDQLTERYGAYFPHSHRYAAFAFAPKDGRRSLHSHLGVKTLKGFGCDDLGPALGAAGALLRYLGDTKPDHVRSVRALERYHREETLVLDPATRRALEVTRTARSGDRKGTLLWSLDRTVTAMGARRLHEWLLSPLRTVGAIQARQEAVGELVDAPARLEAIREALSGIRDLERLAARIAAERAMPRDLAALLASIEKLPALGEALEGAGAPLLRRATQEATPLPTLRNRLATELKEELPTTTTEGGLIREGVSPELDELRGMAAEGKGFIARFQKQEIERTGITSLKIGHNSVFGYYLEVTNTHKSKVPADYKRKQTLKNAERYITDELKRYEEQVTTAKERSDKLEHELFLDLRLAAVAAVAELCSVARAVARLDVLASLAWIARERGYVCPRMEEGSRLLIEEGRHPVLEQTLRDQTFVPNDVCLGAESLDALDQGAVDPTGDLTGPPDPHEVADGSDAGFASEDGGPAAPGGATIAIVTGPNMAGKSTFCRQTALIALMAQVGSFVPARRATLGVCDRIFARIGSADEIQSGLSTFMVEMTETANILNHATDKSLVVLDEVGRGTSTFDGVSLAFAITEHLAREIGARTLFATHYHELTELPEREARAKNLCVDVKEWGEEIIFLHKIVEGSTDKSYGLHVARLAGVPQGVIDRAQDVLQDLERLTLDAKGEPRVRGPQRAAAQGVPAARGPQQLDLFAPPADQLKTALMRLDLANLTPIKALLWLSEWQEKVRG